MHFQFEKSKVDMLEYYNEHYLFNTRNTHSCMRSLCCCCIDDPEQKYLYKGKKLYIKTEKVPEPEDINWDSYEVGCCGKIFRVLISVVIILVFLAISCSIIGLCSIYISSHAVSCDGLVIPSNLENAKSVNATGQLLKCFCTANFIESFNNADIKSYCSTYLDQIYT